MKMDDQNKNVILAIVLSSLVMFGWLFLAPQPAVDPNAAPSLTSEASITPPSGEAATEPAPATLQAAPAQTAGSVSIDTPRLVGSVSLLGGRFDNLRLKDYRETTDPSSELEQLLFPETSATPYYALYGWGPAGSLAATEVPNNNTVWSLDQGETLTPLTPVTLKWQSPNGLIFRREMSVDENYLFAITQSVENTGSSDVRLYPYGLIARHGEPDGAKLFILHEGVVRMSDGELEEIDYSKMPKMDENPAEGALTNIQDVENNGWVGFTDKYWMTSLVPGSDQAFTSVAKYIESREIYTTETRLPVMTAAAGQTIATTSELFAGAKEWETIRTYQNEGGIEGFIDSIDWGMFFFFTKPIFWLLHTLNAMIGNMGWSIIGLTLIIKALLLPLAYKSFVSMAKMKKIQPQMEEIKEKAGDDKQKLQKDMMALYKKEGANPASGCLPILMQIPVFFSLYKVIAVTIELRHAPWVGWINDLASPDPSSILNLFGLLPWGVPAADSIFALVSLGILPIALGISMYLQQKLNPAPTDPTQAMIFAWMPWIFMFMLGSFASGLVLYWIANNMITFSQQYLIMTSQGVKPNVFGNIKSSFSKKKADES